MRKVYGARKWCDAYSQGGRAPLVATYVHHTGALRYPASMATRKAVPAESVRQSVGVGAEAEAKEQLKSSYKRFLAENDPARKNEAGKDLICAIFGKDAIAEDSIR